MCQVQLLINLPNYHAGLYYMYYAIFNEILHLTLSHPGHSGDIILDPIAVDAFIYYLASFII